MPTYDRKINKRKNPAFSKATEPLLNDHISVSDVLQRPSFRHASASTFLCPDNIPGEYNL